MHSLLFVDDDDDIRAIAMMSLSVVGGLQVTQASSGKTAVDLALQLRPDVILLDMMMPDMDGLDTLREIRRHPPLATIPVIFMTAKVQKRDLERYRDAGAIGVVAKPFDPMELPQQIRQLVEANRTRLSG